MKTTIAFGKNLQRIRTGKNISQEKLAELSGLHRTYISGIERGVRNPTLNTIVSIATALGIEPAQLLKGVIHDKK
jgi:transcriptional regulator with XRE-family HTH domain